jgi:hypothetical protein
MPISYLVNVDMNKNHEITIILQLTINKRYNIIIIYNL